ncbi:MAG: hypothetical protein LBQ40_06550 [Clostridiales bacterium]|nr:hypothetical protein [Clostridiales bacterium]
MIRVSTEFNQKNLDGIKGDQKRLYAAGGICASFGVIGGVIFAVVINPVFLLLLIGSAIILCSVFLFARSLKKIAVAKQNKPYFIISFFEDSLTVESIDPSLLTPSKPATYGLSDISLRVSPDGVYYLKINADDSAPSPAYSFNDKGFLEGEPKDLSDLLRGLSA